MLFILWEFEYCDAMGMLGSFLGDLPSHNVMFYLNVINF